MCSDEWVRRMEMVEERPRVLASLGTPRRRHWWDDLLQKGLHGDEMEKT